MKLYFAPNTCSFSPHIVLQELGLAYELVRVNNQTKRTSEGGYFLDVNPKGYVAALQLDTGEVLTEGPAIVQYLADQKPELALAPQIGSFERARLQEWLNFITSELHAGSSPLFNENLPGEVRDMFKEKLCKRLGYIDKVLENQVYIVGNNFTVADAYLFTILGWMPWFDIQLDTWPSIVDYISRIEMRPSVMAAKEREMGIPAC